MKYIFLFLFATGTILYTSAQSSNKYGFTFNHVSISVKDLSRSADFYMNVLGLSEITNRTKKEGIRWMSLGADKELHLISTINEPFTINKAIHFALTTPDFDSFITQLKSHNISFSDWPGISNKITIRADGIKQVYLQDPDGYWIEVNSSTP